MNAVTSLTAFADEYNRLCGAEEYELERYLLSFSGEEVN